MKSFRCGDVVPGCSLELTGTEAQILERVSWHARIDHGLTEVSPALVDAVRASMQPV